MDVERIQQALEDFKFYSAPSNGDSSAPATVGDIRNLISQIEKLVNEIIESWNSAQSAIARWWTEQRLF